jgi:hypothetical protein
MAKKPFPQPHHPSVHKVHRLKQILVWVIIVLGVITLSLGITDMVIANQIVSVSNNGQTTNSAATAIASSSANSSTHLINVQSQLGFSLAYDSAGIDGSGQVTDASSTSSHITGESYKDTELSTARPYSILKLQPKSSDSNSLIALPELVLNTSIRANFWTSLQSEPAYKDKSNIDTLVAYISSSEISDPTITASSTTDVTIGKILYKKVVYSQDNSKYGIKIPTETTAYMTVQNDRPYWIIVSDSNGDSVDSSLLTSLIGSITYTTPITSLLSQATSTLSDASATVTAAPAFTLPAGTSNDPGSLDPTTLVNVVAKNQPAVVRILTVFCGDLTVQSGGASYTQNDSCSGGVGSGSFISGDGYIATNGHVVTLSPKTDLVNSLDSLPRIQGLLTYLVKVGAMSEADAQALNTGVQTGDPAATSALANIGSLIPDSTVSAANASTTYTIQLGNSPVRLDESGTRWKATLNKEVISAKLVDKWYDEASSDLAVANQGSFTTSDVAILKASGNFPAVKLGSIDNLQVGDTLTAIGFPAFIDNSVDTTKWQTTPTVTQGQVVGINPDAAGSSRQLIQTTVQIAKGNSGGPSFNTDGLMIGLNTYGAITCADAACYGDGTVRDVADLKTLLSKDNITLKGSPITTDWDNALDKYVAGNYQGAISLFSKVQSEYPANYLLASLDSAARSRVGSASDTSSTYSAQSVVVTIVWIVGIVGVLGIGVIVILIVHHTRKAHKAGPLPPQPPVLPPTPPTQLPPTSPLPPTMSPQF